MKKTLSILSIILIFSVLAFSEVKIGIINAQKLVEESKKGKEIAEKFEKMKNEKESQFNTMQNEVAKIEKELLSPALNNETREKKSIDLQNKKTELKRFAEDSQQELQLSLEKELNILKNEIKPIIDQLGKEKGFTIILEVPAVAYYDPAADITDEIIKIMDSKYSPK
jgi:outer membrane protein